MRLTRSIFIAAPIDEVFAFLDEPAESLQLHEHARGHIERLDVVGVQPDGCRSFDLYMRSGRRSWVQAIDQLVREAPTRLLTRSWTWQGRRDEPVMTITADRRLIAQGAGTRLDLAIDARIERPWRHPFAVVLNVLFGNGAARLEWDHTLDAMAEHLERSSRANSGRPVSSDIRHH